VEFCKKNFHRCELYNGSTVYRYYHSSFALAGQKFLSDSDLLQFHLFSTLLSEVIILVLALHFTLALILDGGGFGVTVALLNDEDPVSCSIWQLRDHR